MATAISTSVVSATEFLRDFVAFAVANAAFVDQSTGAVTSQGYEIFNLDKTVDGVTASYIFSDNDSYTLYNPLMQRHMECSMSIPGQATAASSRRTFMSLFGVDSAFEGYWFFTEGTCVHAVLEIVPGIFNHMSIGNITKHGTFTGGAYVDAGYYVTYGSSSGIGFYRELDGSQNLNSSTYNQTSAPFAGSDWYSTSNYCGVIHADLGINDTYQIGDQQTTRRAFMFSDRSAFKTRTNGATLRAPLTPSYVRLRNSANNMFHLAGSIPGVRAVNMELINPTEVVNTNWRVFPLIAKVADRNAYPPTGNYALAYEIT